MQLFPERDHRSRRFLALALVLSLVLHVAGGSLWALLVRSARVLTHQPEEVLARTEPITIERLRTPPPTPVPTPVPTPRPRPAQSRPHATRPVQQTLPRRRETPQLAQPTFAPNPEPTAAPRVAKIHVPRAQRVAMVRVPHGARGRAQASGSIDVGALDAQFRQTIAQAQHDVATTPQPDRSAGVSTMKQYNKYLVGNIEDVTGANGSCDPLDDGTYRGGYTWYYLRCTVHYADGYVESVAFPWPFKFTRQNDPFFSRDGRRHEFPGQPPPDGFVLPHPFALSRAVCAFYHAECKAVIDRERANGNAAGRLRIARRAAVSRTRRTAAPLAAAVGRRGLAADPRSRRRGVAAAGPPRPRGRREGAAAPNAHARDRRTLRRDHDREAHGTAGSASQPRGAPATARAAGAGARAGAAAARAARPDAAAAADGGAERCARADAGESAARADPPSARRADRRRRDACASPTSSRCRAARSRRSRSPPSTSSSGARSRPQIAR